MRITSVVIADTNQDFRDQLRTLLDAVPGVRVRQVVGDSQAAFTACAAQIPDVVIADVALAGRTGLSLVRELRAVSDRCLLIVTGLADNGVFRRAALGAGANDYVSKHEAFDAIPTLISAHFPGG